MYFFSKNTLIIILFGVIAIFALIHLDGCHKIKAQADMIDQVNDSLHKTVNKLGQEVAYKRLIVGNLSMLRAVNLSYKDSLLRLIQVSVDKNTIEKTNVVSRTVEDIKAKSVVYKVDTVKKGGLTILYPTYRASWDTKWRKGSVTASRDSVECRDTIINQFDITTEYKRDHLWTSRYPVVEVINRNPHTRTLDVASFHLKHDAGKQSRLVVFLEGVLVGGVAYVVLKK